MLSLKLLAGIVADFPLEIETDRCLRKYKGNDCTLCADLCPHEAIDLKEGVEIDESLCTGCGICAAVCPTGVFERDFPMKQLGEAAKAKVGGTMELACPLVESSAFEVPCIGWLDSGLLIRLLSLGPKEISLNGEKCEQCPQKAGYQLALGVKEQANRTLELLELPGRVSVNTDKKSIKSTGMSRRDFFGFLKDGGMYKAARLVEQLEKDWLRAAKKNKHAKALPLNRQALLAALQKENRKLQDKWQEAEMLGLGEVTIDEKCTYCEQCAFVCPTGALRLSGDDTKAHIELTPAYCTLCGVCQVMCPLDAISLVQGINPFEFKEERSKEIISFEKKTCLQCQEKFVGPLDLCPSCQKKQDMQENFLKMLKQ